MRYFVIIKRVILAVVSIMLHFSAVYADVVNQDVLVAHKEATANTEYLLGHVLKRASDLQETYGNFAPFGAALFRDGSVKYVWYAKPGETVNEPVRSLGLIRKALQAQALNGQIVGSAVIYKYTKPGMPTMQLNVELEYQTGYAEVFAAEMNVDAKNHVSWGGNTRAAYEPKIFAMSQPVTKEDK